MKKLVLATLAALALTACGDNYYATSADGSTPVEVTQIIHDTVTVYEDTFTVKEYVTVQPYAESYTAWTCTETLDLIDSINESEDVLISRGLMYAKEAVEFCESHDMALPSSGEQLESIFDKYFGIFYPNGESDGTSIPSALFTETGYVCQDYVTLYPGRSDWSSSFGSCHTPEEWKDGEHDYGRVFVVCVKEN